MEKEIDVRDEIIGHYTGGDCEGPLYALMDFLSTDQLVDFVHCTAGFDGVGGDDGVEEEFGDQETADAINEYYYDHCE